MKRCCPVCNQRIPKEAFRHWTGNLLDETFEERVRLFRCVVEAWTRTRPKGESSKGIVALGVETFGLTEKEANSVRLSVSNGLPYREEKLARLRKEQGCEITLAIYQPTQETRVA